VAEETIERLARQEGMGHVVSMHVMLAHVTHHKFVDTCVSLYTLTVHL